MFCWKCFFNILILKWDKYYLFITYVLCYYYYCYGFNNNVISRYKHLYSIFYFMISIYINHYNGYITKEIWWQYKYEYYNIYDCLNLIVQVSFLRKLKFFNDKISSILIVCWGKMYYVVYTIYIIYYEYNVYDNL